MKKKNFLCNRFTDFQEMFVPLAIALIIVGAVSFALQSLLIWGGNTFISENNAGLSLASALGAILILPAILAIGFSHDEDSWHILLSLVAIIGIYICIVWYFNWLMLGCCLVILLWNLFKIDMDHVRQFICVYIIFSIAAYFATLINDLEPKADIYSIILLSIVALVIWFSPSFE